MFDKHITEHRSIVAPVTKEVHHSITPDKVTEVYEQAYKQAQRDVLKAYAVKNDLVDFVFVERATMMSSLSVEFAACIRINGKDLHFTVQKNRGIDDSPRAVADHFIKQLAEHLSTEMVIQHVTQFSPSFR